MKIVPSLKERGAVWVWHHTPHCTEITRLASQSFEQPLSFRTRLKMRLHFLICVWCKRYNQQLKFLHHAGSHADHQDKALPGRVLSPEARHRIVQRLKTTEINL